MATFLIVAVFYFGAFCCAALASDPDSVLDDIHPLLPITDFGTQEFQNLDCANPFERVYLVLRYGLYYSNLDPHIVTTTTRELPNHLRHMRSQLFFHTNRHLWSSGRCIKFVDAPDQATRMIFVLATPFESPHFIRDGYLRMEHPAYPRVHLRDINVLPWVVRGVVDEGNLSGREVSIIYYPRYTHKQLKAFLLWRHVDKLYRLEAKHLITLTEGEYGVVRGGKGDGFLRSDAELRKGYFYRQLLERGVFFEGHFSPGARFWPNRDIWPSCNAEFWPLASPIDMLKDIFIQTMDAKNLTERIGVHASRPQENLENIGPERLQFISLRDFDESRYRALSAFAMKAEQCLEKLRRK